MRMRYVVTGLVPARIEVGPGKHPGITHPDLNPVVDALALFKGDSSMQAQVFAAPTQKK